MKKVISLIIILGMLFGFNIGTFAKSENSKTNNKEEKIYCTATIDELFDDETVLVVLKAKYSKINKSVSASDFPNVNIEKIEDLSRIENEKALNKIDKKNYHQILKLTISEKGKEKVLKAIKELEKNNIVLSASPDYFYSSDEIIDNDISTDSVTANDSKIGSQYAVNKINLTNAWTYTKGYSGLKVGVLDTGIDSSHEDLKANLDTSLGINCTDDGLGAWKDQVGHGTHVAGIIGAVGNNSKGVAGTCWNIKMVSIKVFKLDLLSDEVKGKTGWLLNGINYAINNDITILNYSGGGKSYNSAVEAAINNFNGIFICSAGNSAENTDSIAHYPSSLECKNLIAVASTTSTDTLAPNSSYGAKSIDLAAPGVGIWSTIPNNGYDDKSGTSMATPYVTGTAALIKSYNMDLSPIQIRDCILNGVDKVSGLTGKCVTGGRLNAYKSMQLASQIRLAKFSYLAGDFDGDSSAEMVAISGSSSNTNTHLTLWENLSGKYNLSQGMDLYNLGTQIYYVDGRTTCGDYNGDGRDEIAYITGNSDYASVFLLNNSDYSANEYDYPPSKKILSITQFGASDITNRVTSGDFDGDGRDEIGFIEDYIDTNDRYLKFWYVDYKLDGTYSLVFVKRTGTANATSINSGVAAGDFDKDGRDEFGFLYDYGTYLKMFVVGINANGSYDDYPLGPTGSFPGKDIVQNIVAGDFDGDGADEISLLYNYGTYLKMWIFERTASGGFNHYIVGQTGSFLASEVSGVTSGNIKKQGKDEMLVIYKYRPISITWLFELTTNKTFNHYKLV